MKPAEQCMRTQRREEWTFTGFAWMSSSPTVINDLKPREPETLMRVSLYSDSYAVRVQTTRYASRSIFCTMAAANSLVASFSPP
jgi:hypothetical protein